MNAAPLPTVTPLAAPRRTLSLTVDGVVVRVPEGASVLDACRRAQGAAADAGEAVPDVPTLCFGETLTPRNACRVCVVELEGSRTLVPSCSRRAEDAMVIRTDSERVQLSRRMVLEFLGSTADLSLTPHVAEWNDRYSVDTTRYGAPLPADEARDARFPSDAAAPVAAVSGLAATVAAALKDDNDLYVRDYSRCILCYKCVDACGEQWQNTFAIAVAGRGFDARISTEFAVALPDSACVYCGNCIQVCPTGALMARSEHELRADGRWDEAAQTVTTTVCPYCGVGCNVELHVQDGSIVKVTSPADHSVTYGNLCIKGRFGFQHVQNRG